MTSDFFNRLSEDSGCICKSFLVDVLYRLG